MVYYLYKIENNINHKIYVGVHSSKNENDGYMGSGKLISRAIKKYGIENFTKTILERFDTLDEMYAREKEIVNEDFLLRDDVYNLNIGGSGGWKFINDNEEIKTKKSLKYKGSGNPFYGKLILH